MAKSTGRVVVYSGVSSCLSPKNTECYRDVDLILFSAEEFQINFSQKTLLISEIFHELRIRILLVVANTFCFALE